MILPENKDIYSLDIPVLLISSKQDGFVPVEYVKECAVKMKKARLAVLEGGHHVLIANQEDIMKEIRDNYSFLLGQEAL